MIIFFHFLFLVTKYVVHKLSKSLSSEKKSLIYEDYAESTCSLCESNSVMIAQESLTSLTSGSRYLDGSLRFFPPVYIQRYEAVTLILQDPKWKNNIKKVVDFGCAELGFFFHLKQLPGVREILEVDTDESVLERHAFKAEPLVADNLFCKRSDPLDVYIYNGSIADYDDCLIGTDVVVGIELIEHLVPEVLKELPVNVFENIQPKLAIFTTPNADFNTLFPNLIGFRHDDHQFEWSRKEFYNWTREITNKYPNYSVKFYGIGIGPEGTENLGCCTQMAVFHRNEECGEESVIKKPKGINNYKLIKKFDYPFYVDSRSNEDRILDEILYRVKFTFMGVKFYNEDEGLYEIPLKNFMEYIDEWCQSEEELNKLLLDKGFYVKEKEGKGVLLYTGAEPDEDRCCLDDEDSVEMNINDGQPYLDSQQENWDWDCGDGSFNCASPDNTAEEELPSFLSARSLQETARAESSEDRRDSSLLAFENPESIGDAGSNCFVNDTSNKLNDIFSGRMDETIACLPVEESKMKSFTLGRITPEINNREIEPRNQSRSVTALKLWMNTRMGIF